MSYPCTAHGVRHEHQDPGDCATYLAWLPPTTIQPEPYACLLTAGEATDLRLDGWYVWRHGSPVPYGAR